MIRIIRPTVKVNENKIQILEKITSSLTIGLTRSKPGKVLFQEFWVQTLARIKKKIVLLYDTFLIIDTNLSMKYNETIFIMKSEVQCLLLPENVV